VNIAGTYELPIGRGKPLLGNHGAASSILGGWSVSGILTYQQGSPLWNGTGGSVTAPGDPLGNGCAPCNRADVVPGVPQMFNYSSAVANGTSVINPAAFTNPGLWVLGTAPRVLDIRGPWNMNENVSMFKAFNFGERFKAELRMSYFNLLNRVVFGGPSDYVLTDPAFGKVVNSQSNSARQGQAQFMLRF
jgi:hypothetical protein